MKKLLFILAAISLSHLVVGQTPNENYVKTTSYQVKTQNGTTNATTSQTLTDDEKIESITYFDGLGRPVQSIAKQAGGNKQHIITPVEYDVLGRQTKDYLPFAYSANNGAALNYVTPLDVLEDLESYYVHKYPEDQITSSSINAYSEKVFESSPLNRVLEQGAPGSDWLVNPLSDTDHTIKFGYQSNKEDEVEMFRVIFPTLNTEQPQLYYEGFYAAHELYKTITKDENWQPNQVRPKSHTTEEFKDKQGRVILKRTFNGAASHNTYYIYDDFGNLSYVLSPKGSDLVLYQNTYPNFSQSYKCENFVPLDKYENPTSDCEGNVVVTLNATTQELSISFSLSFNTPTDIKSGPLVQLNSTIPNMIVGTITTGGVNYVVSIQDGYLFMAGEGLLSIVTNTFTIDLPNQSVDTDVLDDLCYQYRYDDRNRLVEKKIPQKGWESIVYDKLDRPVLTQDAILRVSNHWLFTKYDAFDRVAYTGLFSDLNSTALTRSELQELVNLQTHLNEEHVQTLNSVGGWSLYYTNNVLQLPSSTMLWDLYTVNYYDTYNPELTAVAANPITIFGESITANTKSLATGSKVKVLGTDDWITSVTYYDSKARPIYVASKNDYLNTTDVVSTQVDFMGKAIQSVSSHTKGTNPAIVVTDDYTYDHAGRLLTQKQQIGSGAQELIVKNTYDELGQLVAKKVGNTETVPLQTVDYSYNIRGWLKEINNPQSLGNDLFWFAINYNSTSLGQNNSELYNGNISETIWKTANDVSSNTTRGYAYQYDVLNRLRTANMSINTGSGYVLASGYHENGLQYDKNGNIMSLQRTGATTVFDNLTYIYDGNQLSKVTDAVTNQQTEGFIDGNTVGDDYTYDANGNMKTDKNKGITNIVYNHLNLPTQVNFGTTNKVQYVYDATGVKLKKRVDDSGQTTFTSYAGNYIYEDAGTETLKFFNHPEGYVEPDGQGNFDYIYQYKDHLGNIRLSYKDVSTTSTPLLEIIEENNYYPFGLKHKGYNNVSTSSNIALKKTFNGKEFQDELGLNWHDYGFRNYDSALGRWMNLDPLAEQMRKHSPYNYAFDNPVYFQDYEGLSPRKGQLANKVEAKKEASKAVEDVKGYKNQLSTLVDHFHKNRRFQYNEKSKSFDEVSSSDQNVKRYVYTEKKGWIDLHHFFRFANYARKFGDNAALNLVETTEKLQAGDSSFSYEDLSSDLAGIDFWQRYGEDIEEGAISILDAFEQYLETMNAKNPEEAPNYEFIPYFDDGKEPKNEYMGYSLRGDDLKNTHKRYYDKRSQKEKDRINAFNEFIATIKKQVENELKND